MMEIHHFGIMAADVEKIMAFYTDVLGLRLMETVNLGGINYYFVGDGRMMLEIEQAYAPGQCQTDSGFSHLALAVNDLEGFCGTLKKKQVKFLLEPSQFRPDRKIAFIEDPEGNKVQLIEFL